MRVAPRQADRAADHGLGDRGGAGAPDRELGHLAPAAQHGDAPAQAHHLVELVADEQDREAPLGQPGERGEQALGLLRRQHGRGLVQDQDAHVAIEGLEDLDPLPLADRQPAHHGIQRHVQPRVGDQALELAPGGTPVAPPAPQGLGAQHDVVEDREVGGQLEMLVHHADAGRQRRVWRARGQGAKLARGVGHQRPAGVGDIVAEQDAHQRRLAGAVLAEQRQGLAAAQLEVDRVVGEQRAE